MDSCLFGLSYCAAVCRRCRVQVRLRLTLGVLRLSGCLALNCLASPASRKTVRWGDIKQLGIKSQQMRINEFLVVFRWFFVQLEWTFFRFPWRVLLQFFLAFVVFLLVYRLQLLRVLKHR